MAQNDGIQVSLFIHSPVSWNLQNSPFCRRFLLEEWRVGDSHITPLQLLIPRRILNIPIVIWRFREWLLVQWRRIWLWRRLLFGRLWPLAFQENWPIFAVIGTQRMSCPYLCSQIPVQKPKEARLFTRWNGVWIRSKIDFESGKKMICILWFGNKFTLFSCSEAGLMIDQMT